ncbi:MAG TPA: LuxR C-terminal-related transcriptional regulator [Humisphaera sp.]|jgi:DNA-binding NarL/FixJ family response regulator|nr:LuxR C-terminal-related transcriptional regulator [Humisphaera sp.]
MDENASIPAIANDSFLAIGDAARRSVSDVRAADREADERRQALAQWCRSMGDQVAGKSTNSRVAPPSPSASVLSAQVQQKASKLPPRQRQTLDRLLAGDSEKQIAARLEVSKHTVHIYVKSLYRRFGVCSRGELLAQFVSQPQTSAT